MSEPTDFGGPGEDDRQAEHWLAALRDGSPPEKAAARRGLAAHFEARGLVAEAIDMLVANAREGHRDAEQFQALARLYRAQGNEYLAASAALEAARLGDRREPSGSAADPSEAPDARSQSSQAPWGQAGPSRPEGAGPEGRRASAKSTSESEHGTGASVDHGAWRRPARILGWLVVVVTLFAALGVSSTSVASSALYIVSAAVLGVLLSGNRSARRLLRLPVGPLGDGTLLFAWLLILLVAGAMVPRGPGFVGAFSQPRATPEAPLYRTPSPSPVP